MQTIQVLTKDVQILILCLSYFITTVQADIYPGANSSKLEHM